jgi:hypothetical protein
MDPEKLKKVRVVVVNDANGKQRNVIYPLQVGYKRYGQCGIEISDWFPHIGSCADEIAFIRGMWTTDDNHGAQVQFHSGRHMLEPRVPTLGAWVTYGLGSMTDNLPSFINMGPRYFDIRDGHYLGPAYDAVNIKVDPKNPLTFAAPEIANRQRRSRRRSLTSSTSSTCLNAEQYPGDKTLAARMKSYQPRLQHADRRAGDDESRLRERRDEESSMAYDDKVTEPFARQLHRRTSSRRARRALHPAPAWRWCRRRVGFAFRPEKESLHARAAGGPSRSPACSKTSSSVACSTTRSSSSPPSLAARPDRKAATGEIIIRMASASGWPAEASKAARSTASTDELGFHAVEHPHYVTDVHATILQLLGLDPHQLEIPGRKRLERDFGHVIGQVLA